MKKLDERLNPFLRRYPETYIVGQKYEEWIIIPNFTLLKGYSKSLTTVSFFIPLGAAKPEHFYVDDDLRLKHGGCLRFTGFPRECPPTGKMQKILLIPYVWNSYRDTLYTFLMTIKCRLDKVM